MAAETYKQTITLTKKLREIALKNSLTILPKENLSGYIQILIKQDDERLKKEKR